MNTLETYEKNQLKELSQGKAFPKFNPGDTLKVHLKIKEGEKERIQVFEGVCISKKSRDINSSFTVRKISFGEGVERTFALFSPIVSSIKVVRSGKVRRAKLYYLRDRTGKSARITEKIKKKIGIDMETQPEQVNAENVDKTSTEKKTEAPKEEKDQLEKMICSIRNIEKALGSKIKKPSESEKKNITVIRKSIVAKTNIKGLRLVFG